MVETTVSAALKSKSMLCESITDLVKRIQPSEPLHLLYPDKIIAKAKEFRRLFDGGTVMYAVKCNPDKEVIKALVRGGIRTFDAASIEEVRLVRKYAPRATIHFMHTVKSREAIREAYFKHGVRVFVLDTVDELHKIIGETDLAPDLSLFIRLALPKNKGAAVDFSVKFGATPKESVALLREARLVAAHLGLMFHAGTQSSDPSAFVRGITTAATVIREAGVVVENLDVGGGFPVPYPTRDVPPLAVYMEAIQAAILAANLGGLKLFCEPGRALVAEAGSLIVRVELRKNAALYLNDGLYGGLIEMLPAQGAFMYPLTHISKENHKQGTMMPYRFCGPTCDSYDMMAGPFWLPDTIAEGDWIEIGMTGAYSNACRTNFNGFGVHKTLLLKAPSV